MATINFTTTNKSITDTGVKLLVYAMSGIGKTVLCATAPRPIILSAEAGLLSLSKKNLQRLFPNDPSVSLDIPVVNINTMQDLDNAYNWIAANLNRGYFETVCLDSVSEIGETLLSKLKATTKDPRQAYGELLDQMTVLLRKFRDLPNVNVYMSAKMDRIKDDASGTLIYGVNMPGSKLGMELPHLFDEVFFMDFVTDQAGKSVRVLHTQPTFRFFAKDRSGALEAMEHPNLTYIINKIRSN
jgi:hypothetical protein